MKKLYLILLIMPIFIFSGCKPKTDDPPLIDWESRSSIRAEQIIHALTIGEYATVFENFNSDLKRAKSKRSLKKEWEGIIQEAGAFVSFLDIEDITFEGEVHQIYGVATQHEHKTVITRTSFDAESGYLITLTFRISDETPDFLHEKSADPIPTRVTVGEGTDFPLNGVLSIPGDFKEEDVPRLPAVVLVHGFGPINMYGTVNGVHMFKDIADALSREGIAVLMYDKRSFQYNDKVTETFGNRLTVWDEVIEDALRAKELLASNKSIDPSKIFVLGYNLGGMLTPRIVSEGDFAGGIIMAGSPLSITEIMPDQINEQNALYYQEMDSYSSELFMSNANTPFYILQGGLDSLFIPERDFAAYQQIAEGRSHIEGMFYPDLNHVFVRSGAYVDAEPMVDIAKWINVK